MSFSTSGRTYLSVLTEIFRKGRYDRVNQREKRDPVSCGLRRRGFLQKNAPASIGTPVRFFIGNQSSLSSGNWPAPQHFLYFLPLPQGQGSLRPTFWAAVLRTGCFFTVSWNQRSAGAPHVPLPASGRDRSPALFPRTWRRPFYRGCRRCPFSPCRPVRRR